MAYSGKECLNLCLTALNKIESIQVYFSQVINGWSHGGSNRYPFPARLLTLLLSARHSQDSVLMPGSPVGG